MNIRFIFFVIVGIILFSTMQDSIAQENSIKISIPSGTSNIGCEVRFLCYIPDPITIHVGDVVEWKNNDTEVHTVTSSSTNEGPDGIIYSDLMNPGEVFAFTFDDPGTFPYFCTLHPWMEGLVIVEVYAGEEKTSNDFDLMEKRISADGSTIIIINTNSPDSGTPLPLEISFTDDNEELLIHMNYDLRVIQDGEEIFIMENIHSVDGIREHSIPVESDNPIDIKIGIRGIYLDSETPQPVEEVLEFQEVPEFGLMAMLVLAGSLTITILLRTKNNVLRFNTN